MVRDTLLWCRKSLESCEIAVRFCHPSDNWKTLSVHQTVKGYLFVVPASGMARYRDPVFHPFVCLSIQLSTFMTTLASTLMFESITLKPSEIMSQNLVQI